MNKGRLRAYNLLWNKHINKLYHSSLSSKLQTLLQTFPNISYSIFTPEKGLQQSPSSFHFQGYLEFYKLADINAFEKKLAYAWDETITFFSDKQLRNGTQQQAIDYVKKENLYKDRKDEQLDEPYSFGMLRGKLSLYNTSDPQIPNDLKKQKVLINQRLKDNYYDNFSDLEKDFTYIFLSENNWLKNLWYRYHPIIKKDVPMLMVYWISGETGVGKTTFANHILYDQLGYSESEIAFYKAPSADHPKFWFDKEDEEAKVLWIEEVDKFYPSRRKLMDIIDRKSRLEVKGSKMRNNLEVLLITSPNTPEQNYSWVKEPNLNREILRRIFQRDPEKSLCLTKVYHIKFSDQKDKFNDVIEISANRENLPLSIKNYWAKYFNDEFNSLHEKLDDLKASLDQSIQIQKEKENKKTGLFSRLRKILFD